MKKKWLFLNNVFMTSTRNSGKKLLTIACSHVSILEAQNNDAEILIIYNRTLPLYNSFTNLYAKWNALKGDVAGETKRFEKLLAQLQPNMYKWNLQIQIVFTVRSADYKLLMPAGRKPFNRGTYEQRVSAVGSLAINLLKFPALAATQLEVQQYYEDLFQARNIQQQKVGLMKSEAAELKSAHHALATILMANLGRLIEKFAATPEKVQSYFYLELIRQHKSKKDENTSGNFVLKIPSDSSKEAGISFGADSRLLFFNDSNIPLEVYTLSGKSDPVPDYTVTINPDEEKVFTPAELGTTGNRFLYVLNNALHEEGLMEITLLKK